MGIDAEMFVRVRGRVTEEQVKEASFLLCAVFGSDAFLVNREMNRRALEIVDEYHQDGPTLKPKKGETFIRVSLWTRYWGPGYERGNLGLILGVAMWLEKRFPKCEVWYGGDSSGVCASLFDAEARDELIAHAASDAGADYRRSSDASQSCEFCGHPMTATRWGVGGTGYICMGCGLRRLVQTDGSFVDGDGKWPDEQRSAS